MTEINISNKSCWTRLAIITDSNGMKLYGEKNHVVNTLHEKLSKDLVYAWQRDGFIMWHLKGQPMHRSVLIDGFEKSTGSSVDIFKDDIKLILQAIEEAGFNVDWKYSVKYGNGKTL